MPGVGILYVRSRSDQSNIVACCSDTCRLISARELSETARLCGNGRSDRVCAGGGSRHETVAKTRRGRAVAAAERLGLRGGPVADEWVRETRRKPPRVAPRAGSDRDSGAANANLGQRGCRYRGDTRRRYGPTHRARDRHLARTTILRAFAALSDARESGSWQENPLGRRCLPHPRVPIHTGRGPGRKQ